PAPPPGSGAWWRSGPGWPSRHPARWDARRLASEVESRGHGGVRRGLVQHGQAEQLLGRAQQRVVVEEGPGRGAGPGARADHDRGYPAAAVGGVVVAVLDGIAAGAFGPGAEYSGGL